MYNHDEDSGIQNNTTYFASTGENTSNYQTIPNGTQEYCLEWSYPPVLSSESCNYIFTNDSYTPKICNFTTNNSILCYQCQLDTNENSSSSGWLPLDITESCNASGYSFRLVFPNQTQCGDFSTEQTSTEMDSSTNSSSGTTPNEDDSIIIFEIIVYVAGSIGAFLLISGVVLVLIFTSTICCCKVWKGTKHI